MSEIVNTSIKKAVKGTALILSGTVISTLLLIAAKILIVRNTTKEELGAYTLSIAVASVLSLIATLGVHEGIARYVSLFVGKNERNEADAVSRTAVRTTLVSGILACLFLYFFSGFIALYVIHSAEVARLLRIASFSIPFFVSAQVLNAILRGHGVITSKVYCLDVGTPLFFLLLLSGAMMLNMPFLSIILSYVVSVFLTYFSIAFYGYRKIGFNPFMLNDGRRGGELFKFSLPLLLGAVMVMIMSWTDTLMLGRYAGPTTVGVYDVSISLARLLMFPLASLEFVFLPIAAELHAQGRSRDLARTYQVLTKWVFSVTGPIFIVLFLYPEQVITSLFSARFVDAAPALRILSCGFLFHALWGPNGILMVVIGLSQEISYVSIFGAILNIMLNYFMVNVYGWGLIGASAATIGTYVALNVLVSVIVYKKSGIQPFTTPYVKAITGAAGAGMIVLLVSSSLPPHAWLVPLYVIFFIVTYCFSLVASKSIDKEDISLFKAIVERAGTQGRILKGSIGRSV